VRAKAWEFAIPWPIEKIEYFCARRRGVTWKKFEPTYGSSGWLTFSIVVWLFVALYVEPSLARFATKYAGDVAKTLLSGALLVGTMLSVSVSLPGQTIVKLVIEDDPESAIEFVTPFLWAFLWGVLATTLMAFFPGLRSITIGYRSTSWIPAAATFVATYAAAMEVHAVLHAIRMYLLGLVISGRKPATVPGPASAPPELPCPNPANRASAPSNRTPAA
jgi:hypothetical protein